MITLSIYSHILVAPGVGLLLLCVSALGSAPEGVLNQSKSSIILKNSMIFALSLKQMSSSSFHMFICAKSEQCGGLRPHLHYNKYAAYQNLSR